MAATQQLNGRAQAIEACYEWATTHRLRVTCAGPAHLHEPTIEETCIQLVPSSQTCTSPHHASRALVVRVPRQLMIHVQDEDRDEHNNSIQTHFSDSDERIRLAVKLARLKADPTSAYTPYINALPTLEDMSAMPITWGKTTALAVLEGTQAHDAVVKQYRDLDKLRGRLADFSSEETALWALVMVLSRAWHIPCSNDKAVMCMGPVWDLLDHDRAARSTWRYDQDADEFVLHAEQPPQTNHDSNTNTCFANYGPKGNGELLCGYGFCLDKNEDDVFVLRFDDDEIDALYRAWVNGGRVDDDDEEEEKLEAYGLLRAARQHVSSCKNTSSGWTLRWNDASHEDDLLREMSLRASDESDWYRTLLVNADTAASPIRRGQRALHASLQGMIARLAKVHARTMSPEAASLSDDARHAIRTYVSTQMELLRRHVRMLETSGMGAGGGDDDDDEEEEDFVVVDGFVASSAAMRACALTGRHFLPSPPSESADDVRSTARRLLAAAYVACGVPEGDHADVDNLLASEDLRESLISAWCDAAISNAASMRAVDAILASADGGEEWRRRLAKLRKLRSKRASENAATRTQKKAKI